MTLLSTLVQCPVSVPMAVCELVNTTHRHHQWVEDSPARAAPGRRGIKFALRVEKLNLGPFSPPNLAITTQAVVASAGSHHYKSVAISNKLASGNPRADYPR